MISVRISQMNDEFKYSRESPSFLTTTVVVIEEKLRSLLLISHQEDQEEKPDICTKLYLVFMIAARSSK